jgi:hypothetical protein
MSSKEKNYETFSKVDFPEKNKAKIGSNLTDKQF